MFPFKFNIKIKLNMRYSLNINLAKPSNFGRKTFILVYLRFERYYMYSLSMIYLLNSIYLIIIDII